MKLCLACDIEHQENEDQSGMRTAPNFEDGSFSFTLCIIMLILLQFMYIKVNETNSLDC